MHFLKRGLTGFLLILIAVAALGYTAMRLTDAMTPDDRARRDSGAERAFVVATGVLQEISATPRITAYGTVKSRRTLALHASASGELVEVSDSFRNGAEVAAGELLFLIDPADPEAAESDAEAALDEAQAEKAEAEEALVAAELEFKAAERQRELRDQALTRQQELKRRGFATDAAVEEAALALANAAQQAVSRNQALVAARRRVERSGLGIVRAGIALSDASRIVGRTSRSAPFKGVLSEVDATLGRQVSTNERLGVLVDVEALEVSFQISNTEYARLVSAGRSIAGSPVVVRLDLGGTVISEQGVLDRVDAFADVTGAGRTVYARLDVGPSSVLRPGDFVAVSIDEPSLDNVARVPASALTENGAMLVIGQDNRLSEVATRILRREGDEMLVSGAPYGEAYVLERAPHLGRGVLVRPLEAPAGAAPGPGPITAAGAAGLSTEGEELIALDPGRREALMGFLETSDRIPEGRKARMLELLAQPEAPKRLIERLEARMREAG